MRTIFFPGSFCPFTKGHADIVERGLALFDRIVIAIGYNEQKATADDLEERLDTIRSLYKDDNRVEVIAYSDLTIKAVRRCGACAILRSIRSIKDYEYELQMSDMNRQLSGIETVVLFARPELASLSSSVVRELQYFGHDITPFLP